MVYIPSFPSKAGTIVALDLFDALLNALSLRWKVPNKPRSKRAYRCECDQPIFFHNSQCLNCNAELGYEPVVGDERADYSQTIKANYEKGPPQAGASTT